MKQFEINKTYFHRWAGDSELISRYTIIRRTAKTIWIQEEKSEEIKMKRVRIYDGAECCDPTGVYSMSPVLSANREVEDVVEDVVTTERIGRGFRWVCGNTKGVDLWWCASRARQDYYDMMDEKIIQFPVAI